MFHLSGGAAPCCAGHFRRGELIGVECCRANTSTAGADTCIWLGHSYCGITVYGVVHETRPSLIFKKKKKAARCEYLKIISVFRDVTAEYGDKLPKYALNQTQWCYAKCLIMLKHRSRASRPIRRSSLHQKSLCLATSTVLNLTL